MTIALLDPARGSSEAGASTSAPWRGARRRSFAKREQFGGTREQFGGACADRLAAFLRGARPTKTACAVAADLGLSARTVEKWMTGEARPNVAAVVALACAYGPEAVAALMRDPPAWLDEAVRLRRRAALDAEMAALQARRDALDAQERP
jgi:transcriptional regulator with XRE-family HTH domain